MKKTSNNMTITIVRILFWLIILVVAMNFPFWLISILSIPEAILLPTAKNEIPTPSLVTATASNSSILFSEDFEDDRAQNFDYISRGLENHRRQHGKQGLRIRQH